MSYLGMKQIQIASEVSLVIGHLLHQRQDTLDKLIGSKKKKKKKITYSFLEKTERICLQNGNPSSKQAVLRPAVPQ